MFPETAAEAVRERRGICRFQSPWIPPLYSQGPQLLLPAPRLPHLILRRAGGEKNLTGIKELCVGISEGQDAALRQLGGQLSPLHVQRFLLWEQDGCQAKLGEAGRAPLAWRLPWGKHNQDESEACGAEDADGAGEWNEHQPGGKETGSPVLLTLPGRRLSPPPALCAS